jgi:hypothetical protein
VVLPLNCNAIPAGAAWAVLIPTAEKNIDRIIKIENSRPVIDVRVFVNLVYIRVLPN